MSDIAAWERRARAWSEAHPPPRGAPMGSRTPASPEEHGEWQAWTRALHAAGLATLHWPPEWGGESASLEATRVVTRVLRQAGAPLPLTDVAINLVGPAIMQFGTPEQQAAHLPAIADGSTVWTQLFSEPDAGSDLAALRLRARPADGGWVLDGQKVWSTYAHLARWGYLLARTGAPDSRHRGLTMFLVPMDAPGITVVPARELTGTADFNEVFFDDVRAGPEAVIGEVDGGWAVSMSTLSEERRVVAGLVIGLEADALRLARTLDDLGDDASDAHVERFGEVLAGTLALAAMTESEHEAPPGFDSVGKVLFSELNLELHQLAVDVAADHPREVPNGWARRWTDNYLYTRGYTISGGANEVMRNVMAKRGLGLK